MKSLAVIIAIVSTLIWGIATLPARLVVPSDHYISPARQFILRQVHGTLWSGQVQINAVRSPAAYSLEWNLNPLCLLALKMCGQISLKNNYSSDSNTQLDFGLTLPIISGVFGGPCGQFNWLQLNDLNGDLDLDVIQLFAPQVNSFENSIEFKQVNIALNRTKGAISAASGEVIWPGGLVGVGGQSPKTIKFVPLTGEIETKGNEISLPIIEEGAGKALEAYTQNSGQDLTLAVYDQLAARAGAVPAGLPKSTAPRIEISQPLKPIVCPSQAKL